jgi:hypothetical protein
VNQRIVLWGALGALVVAAAGGAVVMASGDDGEGDGGPPRLPLAMASAGEEASADAAEPADAAAIGLAPTTYVAGDGLPALGGEAPAYRLPADASSERVSELAGALGLSGRPESTGDGSWALEDGDRRLDVYGPANTWTSYTLVGPDTAVSSGPGAPAPDTPPAPDAPVASDDTGTGGATGGGVSGSSTGSGVRGRVAAPTTTIVCVMAPCEPPVEDPVPDPAGPSTTVAAPTEPAPPTEPGVPAEVPPCVPGPAVLCPAGAPILDEPLPGLPTEEEATAIATELLDATGVDVAGARTTASGGIAEWFVEVEPTVGGLPAPGLASAVTVGVDGVVVSASGPVGPPTGLGDYALLTTAEAIDRLNEAGSVSAAGAAGAAESGAATGSGADPATVAEPEPAVEEDAPTTGTSQPRGKRHQGGVPTTPPGGPPMTPGTALPPDPTMADPDGPATDLPAAPTTEPATTVPGDPGAPATEPAAPSTGGDPGGPVEPAPMPAIVLTEAELVLIAIPSWDDTGSYLVPGYRFSDATGIHATVAAVVDEALLPPE